MLWLEPGAQEKVREAEYAVPSTVKLRPEGLVCTVTWTVGGGVGVAVGVGVGEGVGVGVAVGVGVGVGLGLAKVYVKSTGTYSWLLSGAGVVA